MILPTDLPAPVRPFEWQAGLGWLMAVLANDAT